ncbi:hypothetical protein ACIGFK_12040 [Streptomyces sp. NPDC085524]
MSEHDRDHEATEALEALRTALASHDITLGNCNAATAQRLAAALAAQ